MTKDYKQPTVSVVMPVYNEDSVIFEKSLMSISTNKPDELIVVIDLKEKTDTLYNIAKKYTDKVYKCGLYGKRQNLVYGVKKSIGDIIISVDSDTIFTKTTIQNLIKPFEDNNVGGVTTRQHVINPNRNLISKICQWMEDVRFSTTMPAQSYFGYIGCLPGRAIAFRRDVFTNNYNKFLNETFIGFKCESGDDRVLTSYALQAGYKTVYQSNSVVYTDCPTTWLKFAKQQLRWARSSQRETLKSLTWLWRRPFTFFVFVSDVITPMFFVIVVINSILNYVNGIHIIEIPLYIGLPMAFIGMNISLGIRQHSHLVTHKKDIFYLPYYVLFMTFIMTPIRIIGFFTMFNTGWMTRGKNHET